MERPASFLKSKIYDALCRRNVIPMRPLPLDREARLNRRDWPPIAYTMIGKKRLENLQQCAVDVFQKNVPGDFMEAGTRRGGAAIFLRAVLKAHGIDDRVLYVADSFERLPQADTNRFPAERGYDYSDPFLAVSLDQVKLNFSRFDLLDDQVQFVKGWFKDTLPNLKDHRWSLMRLDGDMYESTMDSLCHLYPNLSPGGYVIIDDYALSSCREAVHDFRAMNQIKEPIHEIDWTGMYWQREA